LKRETKRRRKSRRKRRAQETKNGAGIETAPFFILRRETAFRCGVRRLSLGTLALDGKRERKKRKTERESKPLRFLLDVERRSSGTPNKRPSSDATPGDRR
jgi:hypothetical protein